MLLMLLVWSGVQGQVDWEALWAFRPLPSLSLGCLIGSPLERIQGLIRHKKKFKDRSDAMV